MEFLCTFFAGVNTVLTVGNIWISTKISDLYEEISKNEQISGVLIKIFEAYVVAQLYITNGYQYAYSNFPIVRTVSDRSVYYTSLFTGYIENYKVEPFQRQWVSTHILIKNNHLFKGNDFIHIENYQMVSAELSPDCSYNGKVEQGFMYFFNIVQSLITSLMHVVDAIVVMRDGDRYIVRSILNKHEKFYHKPSKNVFLSIAYEHPNMEKPIPIEFPEGMYEVGNVIFTPMFVKRYLEYQSTSYVFDDKYTLDIIDNDMNMLTLNSKQYGVLTEDGWKVIDIEKETKELEEANHGDSNDEESIENDSTEEPVKETEEKAEEKE